MSGPAALKSYEQTERRRRSRILPELLDPLLKRISCDGVPKPLEPAVDRLVADANDRLEAGPWSVMQKSHLPPEEVDPVRLNLHRMCHRQFELPAPSKHDYISLSVYYWPNPDSEDGLPYVSRPATNPEIEDYDLPNRNRMLEAVDTLALAAAVTGERRYAERAALLLRTWFLDPATAMTPHMTYAQHIPGHEPSPSLYMPRCVGFRDGKPFFVSYGGMIEGSLFAGLPDAVRLLQRSGAWTEADDAALRDWFARFLAWMRESQLGMDEATAVNNHASWWGAQAAAYAEYTGNQEALAEAVDRHMKVRVLLQIEPDGLMPAEMGRHKSWSYVGFTLSSFFNAALVAERAGRDLWRHRTSDGRSVDAAYRWMADRAHGDEAIEGRNLEGISFTEIAPLLVTGGVKYGRPQDLDLADRLPDLPDDHVYRLMFPIEEARRLLVSA